MEEMITAILATEAGEAAVLGIALGPIATAIVGAIRAKTDLDGPVVRWVAVGVSLAMLVLYNVVEGGMTFAAGLSAAAVATVVSIGTHQSAGKWLRKLIGADAGKGSQNASSAQ